MPCTRTVWSVAKNMRCSTLPVMAAVMLLQPMTKRAKRILVTFLFLPAAIYLGVAWYVMREDMAVPILAITTNDSYPGIPPIFARAYLFASDYDPNANIRLGMPALNFIVAGYGLGGKEEAILELSRDFIDKGADINKPWNGFTPLQAAVLANEPIVVRHLLDKGADPRIRLNRPGKPYDNMTALELAEYLVRQQKREMGRVMEILKSQHNTAPQPTAQPLRGFASAELAR